MQFHEWQTLFDEFTRHDKSLRGQSIDQLVVAEYQNIEESPFKIEANRTKRFMRLGLEYSWIKEGKPYYKVHPLMVRKLVNVNLDKIPSHFIEVPEFDVVCFRFAEDVPTRYTDAHAGVTVVSDPSIELHPIYVRSVLFSRIDKKRGKEIKNSAPPDIVDKVSFFDEDNFIFILDQGFRGKAQGFERTLCNSLTIGVREGETISQAIDRALNKEALDISTAVMLSDPRARKRLENLFKVIISIGFLANAPEDNLIIPDILNKDKSAYKEAEKKGDKDRMLVIEERAKRRGHNGWNVGTNEIFVGEMPLLGNSHQSEATGRELHWSHIRGGHPHAVRFGKGKQKVKIKWFRPTRVRKDLPFKAE